MSREIYSDIIISYVTVSVTEKNCLTYATWLLLRYNFISKITFVTVYFISIDYLFIDRIFFTRSIVRKDGFRVLWTFPTHNPRTKFRIVLKSEIIWKHWTLDSLTHSFSIVATYLLISSSLLLWNMLKLRIYLLFYLNFRDCFPRWRVYSSLNRKMPLSRRDIVFDVNVERIERKKNFGTALHENISDISKITLGILIKKIIFRVDRILSGPF